MKINSELPLCMLSCNNQLNEYDFVLFHLYESNQSYKEYFLNQRINHRDRIMIFDNSAYEYYIKGENFNSYSKVTLDGKELETIFLGENVLGLLEEVDPEDVVNMKVSQIETKTNEILSTTE